MLSLLSCPSITQFVALATPSLIVEFVEQVVAADSTVLKIGVSGATVSGTMVATRGPGPLSTKGEAPFSLQEVIVSWSQQFTRLKCC
jgi:hypothetical protein